MARNLLLGTGIAIESEGRIVGSKYQYFTDKFVIPKTGLKGKWVTISFDYEVRGAYGSADIGQARIGFAGAVKRASGASAYHEKWFYPSKDESNPSTEKGRMYLTANLSSYTEEELQTLSCGLYIQRIAGGYARVSNLMFVIGNAQEPWEPAPEDVTCDIPDTLELGALSATAGQPYAKADGTTSIRSPLVDIYGQTLGMMAPVGYLVSVYEYDGGNLVKKTDFTPDGYGWIGAPLASNATQIAFTFSKPDGSVLTNDDIKIISGGYLEND